MSDGGGEALLSEQSRPKVEFVVALQNALVLIVVVLEHRMVSCFADLYTGSLGIGRLFVRCDITDSELMLVDRLLKDMRNGNQV